MVNEVQQEHNQVKKSMRNKENVAVLTRDQ
jgi:hypothetical protein